MTITKEKVFYFLLFSVAFTVYWYTGEGHATYYNYYVRLADAFLHGRIYLLTAPSWLNELIPFSKGYYVVYPPLPAIIMMPLVALFGLQLNQTMVSLFFGGFTVVLAYIVAKDVVKKNTLLQGTVDKTCLWAAILFGFGTLFWWLASVGSVWLIAQVMSVFFLFIGIHEAFNRMRPLVMGLAVGAAFWCRLPTILGIFFFAGLIISREPSINWLTKTVKSLHSLLKLSLGAGIFVMGDMIYNFVRFGTPWDVGYWKIPNILNEPWFNHGLFSLSYIPANLGAFWDGLPILLSHPPYALVPVTGLAIWFTTPAFIYALKIDFKDSITWLSWISIFAIAFVIFTKGLSGWGFGYRYAVDFYPFLYVLAVKGFIPKITWQAKVLIVIAVIVNLWGVLAVNKFNLLV